MIFFLTISSAYSSSWVSYGVPAKDVRAFHIALFLLVFHALAVVLALSAIARSLTRLSSDADKLPHHTVISYDVRKLATSNLYRVLALVLMALPVPFLVSLVNYHVHNLESLTARYFAAVCYGGFALSALLPPPAVAGVLIALQLVGFLETCVANYRARINPNVTSSSKSDRSKHDPGPPYKSRPYQGHNPPSYRSHEKRGSLPSYRTTVDSDLPTISDLWTVIDNGVDVLKVAEDIDRCLADLVPVQVIAGVMQCIVMTFLARSFFLGFGGDDAMKVMFPISFGVCALLVALNFATRLFFLFSGGNRVQRQLTSFRANLREIAMRKRKRASESQMFELNVLTERLKESACLSPNGIFDLNLRTLGILTMFMLINIVTLYVVAYV